MENEFIDNSHKDFAHSWVTASRFIWLCQILVLLVFIVGGSFCLYQHRYKGKPKVEVPDNTLYNPQYK